MSTAMNRYRRERPQGETENIHRQDLADEEEEREKEEESPPN